MLIEDNRSDPTAFWKTLERVSPYKRKSDMSKSFQQGCIHTMWNIAKVVPMYKCGSKLDMDNYRTASILPIFSKTLECVVHNDLNLFSTI